MRIPISQGPQQSLNPLPDAMVRTPGVRGPSTMRAVAETLEEMNKDFTEADNLRVEDQITQKRSVQQGIWNEARQQFGEAVLPKDGKSFTSLYLEKFDADMLKTEEGLGNNRQRRLFRQRSTLLRQNLETQLESHEADQMRVYADQVDAGTIDKESKLAGENFGNVSELALGQIRVEGAVSSSAKRNGWAQEKADDEREKALTQFHGSVIGGALDAGKLGYAQDYLGMYGHQISASARDKFEKVLGNADADTQSLEISRSALEASRAAGLDKTKGYELIDKMAGNNKDVRDKAMASFDHDFKVYQDQQKDLKDQDEASVWREVNNGKGPQSAFKAIATAKNLDDTAKAKLTKEVEKHFRGDAEDRAEAREAKKEAREAALLEYQLNPDRVWQMTEAQLVNLMPKVGSEGVSKLVTLKKAMQKEGPVSFQVDADYFKKVAKDAGITNKRDLLGAQTRIETKISEEQSANAQHPNRKISDERRREIIRYYLTDVMVKDRNPWTGGLGDGTTTKKRWEVENAQDIVAAIPPSHMGEIVAYLERRSRETNRKRAITLADLKPDEIAELDAQLFPKD